MQPSENDPTYSQIAFKASHNSYERDESTAEQLTFNSQKPYNGGCLGLEFDIWRKTSPYENGVKIDENFFRVFHSSPHVWPPLGETLKHYLDRLKEWHNGNNQHDVILISLDIKSSEDGYDDFHKEIDTYLKVYFDESWILKPKDIFALNNSTISAGDTLCGEIVKNGWPTMNYLKGKFIFCLSGNKGWKTEYTMHNLLTERFCFSDSDKPDDDKSVAPPESGNFVFFNFHIFHDHRGVWMNTIPPFTNKNLIVRTYDVDSEDNWRSCLQANVSVISTNKISNHSWAKVSDTHIYKLKNGKPDKRFIKNLGNNEYRTDRATHMSDTFKNPECVFIFEPQENNVYAFRNAKNNEYLQCNITTMSPTNNGNCQRWELIPTGGVDEFYIKNKENGKYLTKRASKLHDGSPGNDEKHLIRSIN
jgi:hypothetical protein